MKTLWTLAVVLVLMSCSGGRMDVAGRYTSQSQNSGEPVQIVMTLAPDGTGKWQVGTEESVFSWSVDGERLRLYTRRGGVLEGRVIAPDFLRVDVPGWGMVEFRR
ncbi:hypothetical protein TDMWS_08760 [Thermodesulfomicrobium sp. WS]|uniref:hypothetical protein n=1 Tax=Thermodesulfomicrobium sp. WS TaxID=3004129 RepID=UPI0024937F4F|nr:hypothetical protein [Thermodesulfomicrobium sp. WS]BDV00791.1 hypothetical protein TDMWS_08760 [Thermodesulfomicrobium sp. WS]